MLIVNIFNIFLFSLFGACIGSFLTMLTYRLPRKEDLVFKKSYCPKCGKELGLKSLIPIFSFIMQKGRCSNCNEKISIRYFIIEFVNCFVYATLFLTFGFTFDCIYLCLLFSLLFTITIVDIETFEIPIYLQFGLLFFAIIYIIFNPVNPLLSMLNVFIYFLVIELCRIIVEKIKKSDEVLGGGDTKIIAICGLFLKFSDLGNFLFLIGIFGFVFGLLWRLIIKSKIFPFAMPIVASLFVLLIKYSL